MTDDNGWANDHVAIQSLLGRIAHLADTGDLADYRDCFIDDAEWWPPRQPTVDISEEPIRGSAALVAGAQQRRDKGIQGPGTNTRHVVSTFDIEPDGPDRARSRAYWRYYVETDSTPRLHSIGRYDDELVRTADGWRMRIRKVSRG
ncbi:nuclear transport factor 2 family protein [Pseudonocardia xishanensis]|uniref:SnoaL-like domain-containing protein n=1 Tax=Pseudonocardia xishanensis TaxID=630995 RepID=A0ABP8RR71_9PSEU